MAARFGAMRALQAFVIPTIILICKGDDQLSNLLQSEMFNYRASEGLCSKEGRFADPLFCGGYLECSRTGQDGSLSERKKTCPNKFSFDELQQKCVPDDACVSSRVGRSLPERSPYNDYLCALSSEAFTCSNCGLSITCSGGLAYESACPGDTSCSNAGPVLGICMESVNECQCGEEAGFMEDAYDETGYWVCNGGQKSANFYRCTGNRLFNKDEKACVNNNGFPLCEDVGFFANPEDCNQYYACMDSTIGFTQNNFTCDDDNYFNELIGMCDDPCNMRDNHFSCEAPGRFADQFSCEKYFECTSESDTKPTKRSCPFGFHWSQQSENGGKCVDPHPNICKPKKVTKCKIPDECNESR